MLVVDHHGPIYSPRGVGPYRPLAGGPGPVWGGGCGSLEVVGSVFLVLCLNYLFLGMVLINV